MDLLLWRLVAVCASLTTVFVAFAVVRARRAERSQTALRTTRNVMEARQRIAITTRLRELVGDRAAQLVRDEARRQNASISSMAVLETVLARAEHYVESQRASIWSQRSGETV